MISQLTSQAACLGDQPCTWHRPQRPSSRCSWSSEGDDIQGSASVLVVSLSWWTSWRHTHRRLSRSLQWHWLGDWLGAGGRAEPPGRVQVWEQHVRKGGWTTSGPRVMQVSFILQPWGYLRSIFHWTRISPIPYFWGLNKFSTNELTSTQVMNWVPQGFPNPWKSLSPPTELCRLQNHTSLWSYLSSLDSRTHFSLIFCIVGYVLQQKKDKVGVLKIPIFWMVNDGIFNPLKDN